MQAFKSLLFISVSLIFLAGCKKGEDDPFFSIYTRKARVSGDWKLDKGSLTIVRDSSGIVSTQEYKFSEGGYTLTAAGNTSVASGAFSLSFTRKGEMTITQKIASLSSSVPDISFKATGFWDFQNGTGEGRSKEKLYLQVTRVTEGRSDNVLLFNKGNAGFSYRLKELRNTEMVMVAENETVSMTQFRTIKINASYTFKQ
jgi:hypothetical protein